MKSGMSMKQTDIADSPRERLFSDVKLDEKDSKIPKKTHKYLRMDQINIAED